MTLTTKPAVLWPPSLFAQVFGMVLISLAASVAVNLIIVFALPPPPPEFYRLSEVVQALRAEGKPVTARNGRTLAATVDAAPCGDTRVRAGVTSDAPRTTADESGLPRTMTTRTQASRACAAAALSHRALG